MATARTPHRFPRIPQARLEDLEDAALWTLAAQGDRACVEEVYQRYWAQMRQHALSIVGSAEAAEDAAQEAFARTLRTVAHGKEIRNVGGWLHTCVHNLSLHAVDDQKRRGHVPYEDLGPGPIQSDAHTCSDLRERSVAVLEAVTTLPKKQRRAFVLSEVKGFDYGEIALELGTSAGNVRVLVHRARSQIRDLLGPQTASAAGPLLGEHFESLDHLLERGSGADLIGSVKQQLMEAAGSVTRWLSSAQDRLDHGALTSGVTVALAAVAIAVPIGLLVEDQAGNDAGDAPGADAVAAPESGSTRYAGGSTGSEWLDAEISLGTAQPGGVVVSLPSAGEPGSPADPAPAAGVGEPGASVPAVGATSESVSNAGSSATADEPTTFYGATCAICDTPGWDLWHSLMSTLAVSPLGESAKTVSSSGVTGFYFSPNEGDASLDSLVLVAVAKLATVAGDAIDRWTRPARSRTATRRAGGKRLARAHARRLRARRSARRRHRSTRRARGTHAARPAPPRDRGRSGPTAAGGNGKQSSSPPAPSGGGGPNPSGPGSDPPSGSSPDGGDSSAPQDPPPSEPEPAFSSPGSDVAKPSIPAPSNVAKPQGLSS